MAGSIEKLMPMPDFALVEGFEGGTCRDHQVDRDFWQVSSVLFINASHKLIRVHIWHAGRCRIFF